MSVSKCDSCSPVQRSCNDYFLARWLAEFNEINTLFVWHDP